MDFNNKEIAMIESCAKWEDEIQEDSRKGMSQINFVIHIPEKSTFYDFELSENELYVPDQYVGYWMTTDKTCEQWGVQDWIEALKEMSWVKCHPQEIKTIEWVQS